VKLTDGGSGLGSLTSAAPHTLRGVSSTSTIRDLAYLDAGFVSSADATYTGCVALAAQDYNATSGGREGVRVSSDGTQALVGFYGGTPVSRQAAIPDTSGAALSALEAEVNKVKQLIRNLNLMAP